MKSLKDYISTAEYSIENPIVGDYIDLELSPWQLIETEVIELTEDGIVLLVDETAQTLIESHAASHYDYVNKHVSMENDDLEENDVDESLSGKANLVYQEMLKQAPDFVYHADSKKLIQAIHKAISLSPGLSIIDLASYAYGIYRTTGTNEAKYQGREVPLGKPMKGDVKKSKVYVKNPKTGKVVKVNFGDKKMKIKKSNPKRRKSFRARHHCANPGPRTKARYWSCRAW